MTATRPEVPIQVITPNDVRASIRRARKSLEDAASEIVWQIEMEAWRTLGYSSWTAMREAEYGGAAFMVPSKSRPEIVARIREAGLTQREAAATAGVSVPTIKRDEHPEWKGSNDPPRDDVIDAEIVEDDEPTTPQPGETIAEHKTTDSAATEPVAITTTCPTCHGTGKVTR